MRVSLLSTLLLAFMICSCDTKFKTSSDSFSLSSDIFVWDHIKELSSDILSTIACKLIEDCCLLVSSFISKLKHWLQSVPRVKAYFKCLLSFIRIKRPTCCYILWSAVLEKRSMPNLENANANHRWLFIVRVLGQYNWLPSLALIEGNAALFQQH